MAVRMTLAEIQQRQEEERARKANEQAEAKAAEDAAVYNLAEVRKLEKQLADTRALAILNEYRWEQAGDRIRKLERLVKHLEAVVFAEGPPEGHGLVEDVQ